MFQFIYLNVKSKLKLLDVGAACNLFGHAPRRFPRRRPSEKGGLPLRWLTACDYQPPQAFKSTGLKTKPRQLHCPASFGD
jgi:hypothetical protein